MKEPPFIKLIDKYLSDTATESEKQLVHEYMYRLEIMGATDVDSEEERLQATMWNHIKNSVVDRAPTTAQMHWYKSRIFRHTAIAASILVLLGLGMLLLFKHQPIGQQIAQHSAKIDTLPSVIRHFKNNSGTKQYI